MNKNHAQMIQNVDRIAHKLESIQHPRANELRRIAQFFGDIGQSSNMIGNFSPGTQNMASEETMPKRPDSLNPNVSSYVKEKPHEEAIVDDRKTHTCTVIFKAPDEVSEAEMMNYILGIGGSLGVEVESFKWSKSEVKQMKPAV